jgi:hypothetical protein
MCSLMNNDMINNNNRYNYNISRLLSHVVMGDIRGVQVFNY